eukprot:6799778-Prymnesium_polylepis.1
MRWRWKRRKVLARRPPAEPECRSTPAEHRNTGGCKARNTGTQRGVEHGTRKRGVRNTEHRQISRARARLLTGAAERLFPLRNHVKKHIFGLVSSSTIHWCKVVFFLLDAISTICARPSSFRSRRAHKVM